jgi:hypothetical protein
MPDDPITEPGQVAGQQPAPEPPAADADGGEEFDKQRAMELIRKLRAKEKELERLQAAEQKRQAEQMTETERLKAEKAAAEKRAAEALAKASQRLARAAVIEAAARAGFNDPSDAWLMVRENLTINEDGEVEGLDRALNRLAKDKPYLLGAPARTAPPSPGNPGLAPKLTADDLNKMTPEEYAERRRTNPDFIKEVRQALRPGQ